MGDNLIGVGCTSKRSGLPNHNPAPSTTRGKRRHSNRNDSQKKHAEKVWDAPRTNRKSRYQKALGLDGYGGKDR